MTRVPTVQIAAARADCEVVETEKPRRRAEVFGVIETALRAHFARQIEPLCYRTSKYRRGRSLLALCIALNTKKSTRHITSIATSDILVVVIVVTGLNRVPDKGWSFRQKREQQAHAGRVSACHEAVAVVLDLVDPVGAGRRLLGAGREAGFDEARRGSRASA